MQMAWGDPDLSDAGIEEYYGVLLVCAATKKTSFGIRLLQEQFRLFGGGRDFF